MKRKVFCHTEETQEVTNVSICLRIALTNFRENSVNVKEKEKIVMSFERLKNEVGDLGKLIFNNIVV